MRLIHPELAGAQVLALAFRRATAEAPEHIDLTLRGRDGAERRLRFLAPLDLHLAPPFPDVGWLQVLDVADRQLEGVGVQVLDGEMSEALRFFAERVVELTAPAV